jgi:hypothetical protein
LDALLNKRLTDAFVKIGWWLKTIPEPAAIARNSGNAQVIHYNKELNNIKMGDFRLNATTA